MKSVKGVRQRVHLEKRASGFQWAFVGSPVTSREREIVLVVEVWVRFWLSSPKSSLSSGDIERCSLLLLSGLSDVDLLLSKLLSLLAGGVSGARGRDGIAVGRAGGSVGRSAAGRPRGFRRRPRSLTVVP